MAVTGRKPKPEGQAVNRHLKEHDWTDVLDEPYLGDCPDLPTHRLVYLKSGPIEVLVSERTQAWWSATCRMPHCVLWQASDWQFALMTALIADGAFGGSITAAAELRMREKIMGTTVDARRDLRIRYVGTEAADEPVAVVASMSDRRRRLTGAS